MKRLQAVLDPRPATLRILQIPERKTCPPDNVAEDGLQVAQSLFLEAAF